MIEVKAEIKGLDTLLEGLKIAPEETVEYIGVGVQKTLIVLQSAALKEAPVNKSFGGGQLRQNIRTSLISKLKGAVISRAPYSIFVHEGTRPHEIRPKVKKGLANRRTGQFFGKLVHHPGTRANPFMQRAYDQSKGKIEQIFDEVVDKVAKLLTK